MNNQKTGSALLVTLLVLSLLVVLVLTFVTVVRVELRTVVEHQNALQARAHARLAGELAIARLQELAGPDTRASFTATAINGMNPAPSNAHWTGIQDTAAYRANTEGGGLVLNPTQGDVMGWLESSTPGGAPDPSVSTVDGSGLPAPGHFLLVGPGSVNTVEGYVAAAATPVWNAHDEPAGEMAWWVGEENSKAQVNLTDPFLVDGEPGTDAWRFHTVQRTASEVLFPGVDPNDPVHQFDLQRASSPAQVGLGRFHTPVDVREHFHDFTLSAHGLPTHPVRGGLKRDLTPVLEETLSNANGLPGGPQYDALLEFQRERMRRWVRENEALPVENPGLPPHRWNAMRAITLRPEQADVNDYGHLMFPPFSDMRLALDPSGPSWSQLLKWTTLHQRRFQGNALQPDRQTNEIRNAKPVIAKFNLGVYKTLDFPRIRLHFIPAVVLWNPYSVPLAPAEYHLIADIRPDSTHGGEFGVCFQVSHPRWEGGSRFWTPPYQMRFTVDGSNDSFRFRLAPVEIPAGAAVIFTLPEHVRFDVVRNNAMPGYTFWQGAIDSGVGGVVENKWIELTPGLHGGGGYSFYVEEPDIRAKIAHSASVQNNRYVNHFNLWSHAGAPLYFPENPRPWPDVLTDEDIGDDHALREMCFNVGGLDPNNGWRIHRSAAVMIRGMGSPRRQLNYVSHTSLGQANLLFGDRDDLHATNSNPARRPWIYIRRLHQYVPKSLHHATPHFNPGVFPEIEGPPPPFNPGEPFRANSPAHSPGFPFWGLTWGLRLPDNIYEYTAATAGGDRLNLESPIAWLAHYNPTATQQARSGWGSNRGMTGTASNLTPPQTTSEALRSIPPILIFPHTPPMITTPSSDTATGWAADGSRDNSPEPFSMKFPGRPMKSSVWGRWHTPIYSPKETPSMDPPIWTAG